MAQHTSPNIPIKIPSKSPIAAPIFEAIVTVIVAPKPYSKTGLDDNSSDGILKTNTLLPNHYKIGQSVGWAKAHLGPYPSWSARFDGDGLGGLCPSYKSTIFRVIREYIVIF